MNNLKATNIFVECLTYFFQRKPTQSNVWIYICLLTLLENWYFKPSKTHISEYITPKWLNIVQFQRAKSQRQSIAKTKKKPTTTQVHMINDIKPVSNVVRSFVRCSVETQIPVQLRLFCVHFVCFVGEIKTEKQTIHWIHRWESSSRVQSEWYMRSRLK